MGRDTTLNATNFASGRIPLFVRRDNVTVEEAVIRVINSLLNWVTFVFLLDGLYNVAAAGVMAAR